jgi:integrase/recombinase XerD
MARHLNAPMLDQRQVYLAQLSALGRSRRSVVIHASTLCHVVEGFNLCSLKRVTEDDISEAARRWRENIVAKSNLPPVGREEEFKTVARSWCRFLGVYAPRERDKHQVETYLLDFRNAMQSEIGYLPSTIRAWTSPTRRFLRWISSRQQDLASVRLEDVDVFIAERRSSGAKSRTIACDCQALRAFFRHAKQRGWNQHGLGQIIRAPIAKRQISPPDCPTWENVRKMLDTLDVSRPSDCRAKVVILLASVYGLRCSEIIHLTLDDIDWHHEVITVRRVKRGRVQQFPLQFEVGEAIIPYLKKFRPASRLRNLILTLTTPYRPALSLTSAMAHILSGPRMMGRPCGLHALRHACATELLSRGTSLQGIADLLGHSNLRSVSIYARCNQKVLQRVADFSLSGIL